MTRSFKVVDLFAGPGGLAEGLSRFEVAGHRPFEIALSVEKEDSAFATLRLRAFVRQFGVELPEDYYRFMAGEVTHAELISRWPEQWAAAKAETLQLELGDAWAASEIDPRLDAIRDAAGGETVLIGGPPCQAYSLVGRARNRGKTDYVPREDHRHFLYQEYIRILSRLRPAAFVMENVKGLLSANVDGVDIFTQVIEDLQAAGGEAGSYQLLELAPGNSAGRKAHIIQSENFGVPQRRHRVILLGVRKDISTSAGELPLPRARLESVVTMATVADVLAGMPVLRSGVSKRVDDSEQWREIVVGAFRIAAAAAMAEEDEDLDKVAAALVDHASAISRADPLPPRASTRTASVTRNELADWLVDQRMTSLPHHESRSHMAADLARYAFVSTFNEVLGRSPKAKAFPSGLAPDHRNWSTGKFADRFRVQGWHSPSTTVTSHIGKDGHAFIHPDPRQCRSLTVREAARLQTFPDNYYFMGNRTQQYVQVGNAVPPLLAKQIASVVYSVLAGA